MPWWFQIFNLNITNAHLASFFLLLRFVLDINGLWKHLLINFFLSLDLHYLNYLVLYFLFWLHFVFLLLLLALCSWSIRVDNSFSPIIDALYGQLHVVWIFFSLLFCVMGAWFLSNCSKNFSSIMSGWNLVCGLFWVDLFSSLNLNWNITLLRGWDLILINMIVRLKRVLIGSTFLFFFFFIASIHNWLVRRDVIEGDLSLLLDSWGFYYVWEVVDVLSCRLEIELLGYTFYRRDIAGCSIATGDGVIFNHKLLSQNVGSAEEGWLRLQHQGWPSHRQVESSSWNRRLRWGIFYDLVLLTFLPGGLLKYEAGPHVWIEGSQL